MKTLNTKEKIWFNKWFVGYTDGDGCFNVYANSLTNKIIFTFKISQKTNNIQVLYYFKQQLGCGKVSSTNDGMSHYVIRKKEHLKLVLIPIFIENKLLTSKEYSFLVFCECLKISDKEDLLQSSKIAEILKIKNNKINHDFIASSWRTLSTPLNFNNILHKAWIVGFVEAEGSFYIVKKDDKRLNHGFGITQKKDKIILDALKNILNINANVKWNKKGFFSLDALDKKSLKYIKDYFFKTMKSRKSLQYRIWARSFRHKQNYKKLKQIQNLMRKI